MGRIGAGEFGTLLVGVFGPLLHLALAGGLIYWGRQLQGRGKGAHAVWGWRAAVLALVAPVLGILVTVLLLMVAFSGLDAIDPGRRAAVLAEGIATAMWGTAIGAGLSLPLYVLSLGLLISASRRALP